MLDNREGDFRCLGCNGTYWRKQQWIHDKCVPFGKVAVEDPVTVEVILSPDPVEVEPGDKLDRKEYMREYMRKKRESLKVVSNG